MIKFLVLGVASVQADLIEYLNENNIETHAVAMRNDGPGAEIANHFEEINILDKESLEKYIVDNKIDAVYSVGSDIAMPIVGYLSEKFKLPYFTSKAVAKVCNNKNLMREITKNCKGSIKTLILDGPVNEDVNLRYPLIVKPSDGQGQRGINLVHDYEDLNSAIKHSIDFSRNKLVVVEEYKAGYEVSVNGYLINGKMSFMLVSGRETWKEYTGLIHKHIADDSISYPTKEIEEVMIQHCKAIGIENGPVYAQLKVENNVPYMIEITPRFDGCHMHKVIKYHTGNDLLDMSIKHLLNGIQPNFTDNIIMPVTLEFKCEIPNNKVDYSKFKINENIIEEYNYYKNGEIIRPVNGVYDKVGYYIYSKKGD